MTSEKFVRDSHPCRKERGKDGAPRFVVVRTINAGSSTPRRFAQNDILVGLRWLLGRGGGGAQAFALGESGQ